MHSWEELLVSTADEKKMGREFDSLVRRGDPSVLKSGERIFVPAAGNDAQRDLYNFYQKRGKEMVNLIDSKDLDALMTTEKLCRNNQDNQSEKVACNKNNFFEFKIIESNQMNAFAVPGGYVYFYTKILKSSQGGFRSESELMSVMGHEIGHVVLHHSRDRIVKQYGASALIELLLGDGMGALLASLGANFWLTKNGQEDESQSDSMGFYYTNKMGISSEGLSDFFARGLQTYDPATGTCNEKAESSLSDVFSTHPPSCKRVNDNNNRIRRANQTAQTHPKDKHEENGKKFTQLVTSAGI
ncbi:MAG: M48 family metalloprotease [Fibromonadales bacterium]|nr:M48 family metalloprotease [Fibromonadales bacterium]